MAEPRRALAFYGSVKSGSSSLATTALCTPPGKGVAPAPCQSSALWAERTPGAEAAIDAASTAHARITAFGRFGSRERAKSRILLGSWRYIPAKAITIRRSEEHTSELQSLAY